MVDVNYLTSFVANSYLNSSRFSGVELSILVDRLGLSEDAARGTIDALVARGELQLNFREDDPEPQTLSTWPLCLDAQIEKLHRNSPKDIYLFPTADSAEHYVDVKEFQGKPFTLQRALGFPEYCYECFDLSVLENYSDRPAFSLDVSEVGGRIRTKPAGTNGDSNGHEQLMFLESFGFCYGERHPRAVAVFLKHLCDLPEEHQELWQSKLLSEQCSLHPDYVDVALGAAEPKLSMFDAFIAELTLINQMCRRMDRLPLFVSVPSSDADRPVDFKVPLRSSYDEFVGFVDALDGLMSENINRKFFLDEVPQAKKKGGIRLLEDWVSERFVPHKAVVQRVASQFKLVRRLRQRTAKRSRGAAYNGESYKRQCELLTDSYQALRSLRSILGRDPEAKQVVVPQPLSDGVFLAL